MSIPQTERLHFRTHDALVSAAGRVQVSTGHIAGGSATEAP